MKINVKAGVAALLGATSFSALASAADLPLRTAPPTFVAPTLVSGWDGFYVGSTYGYGFTDFTTRQATSRSRTFDGQSGGALAGYNFQSGHIVYGAEAGIDLNVIRGTIPGQVGLTGSRLDSLDDIRFRGRIGYEFGWIMPFVAGGAVINESYQSFTATTAAGGLTNFGRIHHEVGFTVGGGVDVKLNPRNILPFLPEAFFGPLILRAEYLHDEIGRRTYTLDPAGLAGAPQNYRTESSSNLIRLAIIYRFGDTAPRPYADSLGNVNWAGGYGGIFGGYGDTDTHSRFAGAARRTVNADGGIGGIYAGSNFMFFNSKVMLGFDGSTSWSDLTGNGTEPSFGDAVRNREYIQADLRARAGYAFGSFLPFVAAGVAFSRTEERNLGPNFPGAEVGRVAFDNFTVGGGLDYRISQRVSLRGEYLYETSINTKTVNLTNTGVRQDRDANIVRFGAAYHFE